MKFGFHLKKIRKQIKSNLYRVSNFFYLGPKHWMFLLKFNFSNLFRMHILNARLVPKVTFEECFNKKI